MDLSKLDFKGIFEALIGFLTALLKGVGVVSPDEDAPYKPYIDDAKDLFDAIKTALDK